MLENYRVFRCILDPRGIPAGVLLPEAWLKLDSVDKVHERYVLSVSFLERFPDLASAHEYGTRVAAGANAAMNERESSRLDPNKMVQYIGHYQMRFGALRARFWSYHTVAFSWRPEGPLNDHCEIEISWNGVASASTKRQRTDERREIVEWLFNILFGPFRFQDPQGRHVGSIDLPEIFEKPAA